MDVWASWCGPCVSEISTLRNLAAWYRHNNQVIFVSVSIDSKKGLQYLSTGFSPISKTSLPPFVMSAKETNG
jgi:thiol-disulfide isomerase/thioredoxin